MRFDDRLLTVLNQPADDRYDRAVRWRQLVDLVARAGSSQAVPRSSRPWTLSATTQHRSTNRFAPPPPDRSPPGHCPSGLLDYFASETLAVAAPVLAAAKLEPEEWRRLHEAADDEARAFIASLHPDAMGARNPIDTVPQTAIPDADKPARPYTPPSLHEVVERIERRRQMRAREMAAVRRCRPAGARAAVAVPLGVRSGRGNCLGRGSAARAVDRALDRQDATRAAAIASTVRSHGHSACARLSAMPRCA